MFRSLLITGRIGRQFLGDRHTIRDQKRRRPRPYIAWQPRRERPATGQNMLANLQGLNRNLKVKVTVIGDSANHLTSAQQETEAEASVEPVAQVVSNVVSTVEDGNAVI
ncbi:hypothetical protein BSKO_13370 [Bryopsis sp. KO-2023]|nr:hypothetical protein BSKO_13370 [Bryopsis sp. KO-2023]